MGSAEIQGSLWGQAPRMWAERQEPLHAPLWHAMLAATGIGPAKNVLDAGCGAGGASVLFANAGAAVSGIDASDALVDIARERVPNGDFRVGDLEELPFADGAFDIVVAANSVQYAADQVAALRQLKRVAAPGGCIAIGIWGRAENCEFRHVAAAIAAAMPEPPKGGGPFALSEPGALEALLDRAGLTADARAEVACPFVYPDVESAWVAQASAGPTQAAIRAAGGAAAKAAFAGAVKPFVVEGGEVRIANTMLYVTATA